MVTTNTSQQSTQVGTNLDSVTYYSTQLPFIDLFKASAPWVTQTNTTWDTKESSKLDLDANGWVRSLPQSGANFTKVGTLMNRVGGNYPGGRYVVLYEGEGTIQYGSDAKRNVAASTPGRDVIDVTPSNAGIYLAITATDPNRTGNYIRNIRVVPEAYEQTYQTQIFNPELIEKIDDFSSFRFMDWMRTNNSDQGDWNNRPRLEDSTYATGKGVPIEVMIELANKTGKDPWFTIPHQATDEYITNFAKLVKEKLNPNLKVHVEYSNEVWNPIFEQYQWVTEQAAKEGMQWYQWYARRTEQIGDIWDSVLGNDRVDTVLSGQSGNAWVAGQALNTVKQYDPNYTVDSLAIAPYVSLRASQANAAEIEGWTQDPDGGLNKVFQEINQGGVLSNGKPGGALAAALDHVTKHATLSDQYGLDLVAYEGGQHLDTNQDGTENNQAITDLFIQANRDPRMGEVYRKYLEGLQERGLDTFMNFVAIGQPSRWGSWGALEHVGQDSSPKYDALIDFINQNAPVVSTPVDPPPTDPTTPVVSTPVNPTLTDPNNGGTLPTDSPLVEPTITGETLPTDPNTLGATPVMPSPADPTFVNNPINSSGNSISMTPTAIPTLSGGNQPNPIAAVRPRNIFTRSGVINLRKLDLNQDGRIDRTVKLSFSDIHSNALYNNSVGFYKVANTRGDVLDPVSGTLIQPGKAGYARAALQQRLRGVNLTRDTGDVTVRTSTNTLLAPFLIANSTPGEYLSKDANGSEKIPHAYFAFRGANADRARHVRVLNGNTFGFEDLWRGGDKDFDDFAFKVTAQPV
ncbi:DUF4114 domain-containing protein [Oscillatoria sp. FACHB-1407]|uniref:DUF4114 domain-containing protein n=1 Tax=Oscillatoria sp. FACHB-1407 TaxID=2692847 RepID=UPI00168710FC|nr:DUF4114 domain-containing protein [Oscillatoria sp. FACHB-1407]MBD2463651.1 DUF4114 domain-containing protein [Oscillatoria sp. FACHB-1407]